MKITYSREQLLSLCQNNTTPPPDINTDEEIPLTYSARFTLLFQSLSARMPHECAPTRALPYDKDDQDDPEDSLSLSACPAA
ncbi:hypothetical protein BN59_03316 [Legionella massiliensis]|uniref:Uncharacterized protein n=1 Tax=Legionella massiliensis TaxID=1034943 RepID=A0A078L1D6_9GAMM|nr:hypothetical protein [Legionella massiliensis]CDZ79001.1 hypothetical protein BN59_03316 [Legionella massiliensis]CEE14739.1 hypothetical protein BN1094_03316 [Legionella massiliensis]